MRLVAISISVVLAIALSGCGATTPLRVGEPDLRVTICGHVLATGATVPGVRTLAPPFEPPSAPAASILPAPYQGREPGSAAVKIVRVAQGCAEGAIVLVTPTDQLRLQTTVRAADGTIIAVVLVRISDAPGTSATVYAYRNGTAIGQLPV